MIVCICLNISDHDILRYVAANPHATEFDFCTKTGLGRECGICMESFEEIFNGLGKVAKNANIDLEKIPHLKSGERHERKKSHHRRAK